MKKFLPYLVLLFTLLLYSKSLFYGFVNFDDPLYITANKHVLNFSFESVQFFFSNFMHGHYFPLTLLTYGIQNALFGLDGFYFHLFNVILHLLGVWGVYQLGLLAFSNQNVALFAMTLFAFHPLQVESVSWLGTRGSLLSGVFSIYSLLHYLKYVKGNLHSKSLFWSTLFLLLALLSKSGAIVLPIIFFAIDYWQNRSLKLNLFLEKTPYLVLSLVFGIVAILAARDLGSVAEGFSSFEGVSINRISFILYSLSFYFNKFFVPINLTAMHYDPKLIDGAYSIGFYFAPLPFVLFSFWMLISNRLQRFVWLFYFLSYLLVINILPLGGTIVSERYAYTGNLSLMLFLSYFIFIKLKNTSFSLQAKKTLVIVISTIFFVFSFQRQEVWANSKQLFQDMLEKRKDSDHALSGLAKAYATEGEMEKALELITKAIEISPKHAHFTTRASIKIIMDSTESAMNDITEAMKRSISSTDIYYKRAILKQLDGNLSGALQDYSISIGLNEEDMYSLFNRGAIRYKLGDERGACQDWEKAELLGYQMAKVLRNEVCLNTKSQKIRTQKLKEINYPNGNVALRVIKEEENDIMYVERFDSLGVLLERGQINEQGEYDGSVTWFYPSGRKKVEGNYKGIVPVEAWQEYYENGTLKANYFYRNGTLDSTYTIYYTNGNLWSIRQYSTGKLMNVDIVLSKHGDTLATGSLQDGNGNLFIYNEDAKIQDTLSFKGGIEKK